MNIKQMNWIISLLLLCFMCLTIGCTNTPSSHSLSNNILQLRLGGEPSVLNPILSTDSPSSSVGGMIFDGLMRVNEELELEPNIAESYTINETNHIVLIALGHYL